MLALAARNLLRNRRRSLATLLAITIGEVAILLFGGYKFDIEYNLETDYVRRGGHLQIQHRDFYLFGSGNQAAYGIAEYGGIVAAIRSDPILGSLVNVVTPTLQFGGIAGHYAAGVSRTVVANGLVAADHQKMREWNPMGISFGLPLVGLDAGQSNAAVVGQGLARVLHLCEGLGLADCAKPIQTEAAGGADIPADIGALAAGESGAGGGGPEKVPPAVRQGDAKTPPATTIEVLASSGRGTPNVATLAVVAAERQGLKELDEIFVMLHLGQAQRLVYGPTGAKVTSIMVQLHDSTKMPAAARRIEEQLPKWSGNQPLSVKTFVELNPFFVQSVQLFDTIFGFMFVLVGGIVMFTVSNTMNTAVVERTVEVGTLRAMGLRQAGIRRLFLVEGGLLGVAGSVCGAVLAVVIASIFNRMGVEWFPPGGAGYVPLALQVSGEPSMITTATVGLIGLTTLSAWWPAHRASKLKIVDALRHV